MKNPDKIPSHIMEDLAERGLAPIDMERMTPEQLFEEYCHWHGIFGYGLDEVLDSLREADK